MNIHVPHVPASAEWWLGPFVGGATGLMTAATGLMYPLILLLASVGIIESPASAKFPKKIEEVAITQ
jgi:hypothetical protein